MIRSIRILFLLFLFTLAAVQLHAQVTTGTAPFGSFGGGPDTINLANLNSHITIPVLHKAGRGTNFTYDLSYDSSVWYPVTSGTSTVWTPVLDWGWRGQTEIATGYISFSITNTFVRFPVCNITTYSNFVYHDPFGVPHGFNGSAIWDQNPGSGCTARITPLTAVAGDGSGFTLYANGTGGAYVVSSKGRTINAPLNTNAGSSTAIDRNGNIISGSSGQFFDTLSSSVPVLTVAGSGTSTSPMTFTYTAPSGASAYYQINYTNYTVATNFGVSGITEYKSSAAVPLVSSVVLPDGTQYSFQYEATPSTPASGACTPYAGTTCVTARVTSVTLPTGGTITYSYAGGNNGIFPDGSTAGLKRHTPDTGSSAYWNYSRTQETGAASITTVTDPTSQANQTLIQFQGIYETQRDVYSGSAPTISTFPIPESTLQTSNLLKEIQACYNANTSSCTSTAITLPITQRNITTLLSGASSWASAQTTQHVYKYNSKGSLIEQDDYDYGTGTVGALLKKTSITYASLTNITAFRQQVTVTNGSGATVSQINYNYGDTVTATSGTPQHTTPSSSRGNLLSVNYYTQGSTYLTKSYTYFDTGNVYVATDVNGAQTTYTYGACGNSFPTSVAEPLSLSRSMTWNCTGGVETSVTDENGNVASMSYTNDPDFWRPNSTTDPTNAITSFTYTRQTQAESDLPVVSGSSASDVLSTRDSQGRPSLTQIRQTPGGSTFDTAETDYDVKGRPDRGTLPFAASAGQTSPSAPGTTTTYDALNRVTGTTDSGTSTVANAYSQNDVVVTRGPAPTGENTKRHQSQYDALRRLTSVCEITSSTGSGNCAQNNSQTGFWTKYTYDALGHLTGVTQNAQSSSKQSRSFVYDLMGRMTSETEAESGTTTYTYDTDSTCGTSSGDLVKRIDAVGNVTCYSYDALHRPLSVTYPSGSYSSKTPNKYFVYDTATVNGVAMTNGKSRMVEAYTATTQSGTKITDAGFSYTVRGEPSDVYEATPNSGGYYHVNEQFWANGGMKQLSGLSSLPTFTFNTDGEGRIYQVSASSGQNPVTNTAFNNASLPTSVTFGSTDSDSFTYDPNTNRMTQYQFSVNGQSLTGALTWNANATLQNLNITDALNSADTQSCAYVYDDLMRIQSANCGSVWSQTFSYDAFGNISKSGSMSFQALYSSSTNQITSVGGFNPTYDANGNILTDPAHTYGWDSAGRPVSIDTVNMTYDALGRMVEQNRSGVYTQFVYGPHGGKFAIMSGQTLQKAFIPLTGGAQAVYNASGLLYYGHSDHLGSIRLGSTTSRTVSFDLAYAPFGETYASSGSTDPAFTGQRQDTVSGLYDFPAREYSTEGRWPSPDPSGISAFHLTDPQSINRYVYARNTPLSVVDPTGLDDVFLCDFCDDGGGGGDGGDGGDGGGGGVIGDPTSGGPQDNSGGGCSPDDPSCAGYINPNPAGCGLQACIPVDNSGPIISGVVPVGQPSFLGSPSGNSGGFIQVTYQVVDQNGNPMPIEGVVPTEWGSVSQQVPGTNVSMTVPILDPNNNPLQGPPGGCIIANCGGTNSLGQFTDTVGGPSSATINQTIALTSGPQNGFSIYSTQNVQWTVTVSNGVTTVAGSNGASASSASSSPAP
ncbi:MAG: RHS repeat-associated core domain-containing protein [Candidatus Acidiferrum sp.]